VLIPQRAACLHARLLCHDCLLLTCLFLRLLPGVPATWRLLPECSLHNRRVTSGPARRFMMMAFWKIQKSNKVAQFEAELLGYLDRLTDTERCLLYYYTLNTCDLPWSLGD